MAEPAQMPTQIFCPQPPTDVPTGLAILAQVERLVVHQQIDLLEVISGVDTNNSYVVMDTAHQQLFFAAEENDCCNRMCCGSSRSFTISLTDKQDHELEVHSPRGNPIGYVVQNWHPCVPKFTIMNERREPVLKIVGQCCLGCVGRVHFKIKTKDSSSLIGAIFKQPVGFVQERFTNADNYGLQFPKDLDVKIKATLLGACILIDFMYFERRPARATRGPSPMYSNQYR